MDTSGFTGVRKGCRKAVPLLSITHLQDLDLCRVGGPDVEALQVGLKHALAQESSASALSSRTTCRGPISSLPHRRPPILNFSPLPFQIWQGLSSLGFAPSAALRIQACLLHLHLGSPLHYTVPPSTPQPAFPRTPRAHRSHPSVPCSPGA